MKQVVALLACSDYVQDSVNAALDRALELVGGMRAFIKPGMRVLIKPNLVLPRSPECAVTTHPSVIRAIARQVRCAGGIPLLAESPGGPFSEWALRRVYQATGMLELEKEGIALNWDCSSVTVSEPAGRTLHQMTLLKAVEQADAVISAAKLKTHGLTAYTGAVKNLFGAVPGVTKAEYHDRYATLTDFSNMLLDIAEHIKPALSVIDGIVGMEGEGPSAGSPRHIGALIVSGNAHACDSVAAGLIGLSQQDVPTLKIAGERGLIPQYDVRGANLADLAARDFHTVPIQWKNNYKFELLGMLLQSRPQVNKSLCLGCGACLKTCPRQAIRMQGPFPAFNYKNCIRCFCCQELCPATAIDIKRYPWVRWLR